MPNATRTQGPSPGTLAALDHSLALDTRKAAGVVHRDVKPDHVLERSAAALAVAAGGDPQAAPVAAHRPRIPTPRVIPWVDRRPPWIALRSVVAVVLSAIARSALALLGAHVSGGAARSRDGSARARAPEDRAVLGGERRAAPHVAELAARLAVPDVDVRREPALERGVGGEVSPGDHHHPILRPARPPSTVRSIVRARTTGRATPIPTCPHSWGAGVTVATPHELAYDPSAELVVTAPAPPSEGWSTSGGRRGSVDGGRR